MTEKVKSKKLGRPINIDRNITTYVMSREALDYLNLVAKEGFEKSKFLNKLILADKEKGKDSFLSKMKSLGDLS